MHPIKLFCITACLSCAATLPRTVGAVGPEPMPTALYEVQPANDQGTYLLTAGDAAIVAELVEPAKAPVTGTFAVRLEVGNDGAQLLEQGLRVEIWRTPPADEFSRMLPVPTMQWSSDCVVRVEAKGTADALVEIPQRPQLGDRLIVRLPGKADSMALPWGDRDDAVRPSGQPADLTDRILSVVEGG